MPNNLIYYKVTVHWPSPEGVFFIAGDKKNNTVFYFLAIDDEPLATLDLNDKKAFFPRIGNFAIGAVGTATCELYKAMQNNSFPPLIAHPTCAKYVVLEQISPLQKGNKISSAKMIGKLNAVCKVLLVTIFFVMGLKLLLGW